MNDLKRVAKLVAKLQVFIERLEQNHSIIVHHQVNQFYYMQKSSELQLLYDELEALLKKKDAIEEMLAVVYPKIATQWKKDLLWLSRINSNMEKKKAIL